MGMKVETTNLHISSVFSFCGDRGVEVMGVEGAVGNTYEIVLAPKTTLAFRDCCFLPDIISLVFHACSSQTLAPRPKYISPSHRIVCHRKTVHRLPGYHNPSIQPKQLDSLISKDCSSLAWGSRALAHMHLDTAVFQDCSSPTWVPELGCLIPSA